MLSRESLGPMTEKEREQYLLLTLDKVREIRSRLSKLYVEEKVPEEYKDYADNLLHDINGIISNIWHRVSNHDVELKIFHYYYDLNVHCNSIEVLLELLKLKGIK